MKMMSRRVVITGLGIFSSIGNSFDEITFNLKAGISGITKVQAWEELGIKSCLAGEIKGVVEKMENSGISKKIFNCMSEAAIMGTLAAQDAFADANINSQEMVLRDIACIVGSGVSSTEAIYKGADLLFNNNIKKMSPYTIVRSMCSSPSAAITNSFKLTGRSYSLSSACATSTHNLGHAYELIKSGLIDIAVAGGCEEVTPITTSAFMAMRMALSTAYTDTPTQASRPYDKDRDGFIMSGGAGILILESLESAKKRGARIYAEIIGYHANADGHDMIMPEPNGQQTGKCIKKALENAGIKPRDVDYINTHGTSTVIGDLSELKAIQIAFGGDIPSISSTKAMTGHPIAAAGGIETIFCLSMLKHQFVAPSINVFHLDEACEGFPIVTQLIEKKIDIILNNNFGFGGTNAAIVLRKFND
jgi:3-oxoacyl-[acyl-carrier-protein] synthase-1